MDGLMPELLKIYYVIKFHKNTLKHKNKAIKMMEMMVISVDCLK